MIRLLLSLLICLVTSVSAQVNSGGDRTIADHGKQVIGYVPQYDAWKASNYGFSKQGVLNQLNLDYRKYTILNFSFFGVASDGSLHSADLRNQQIYQQGQTQAPGQILMTDVYSSWDYWILFGQVTPTWEVTTAAAAQGFSATGSGWKNDGLGISETPFPIPLKDANGPKGLIDLCHENGIKCMASIGGWSMSKHFHEMAADATMRARFLADCERLISLGFDGIDIDWEYPGAFAGMNFTGTPQDYAHFATLMEQIRATIGPDKLLTAAFAAQKEKLAGFDWPRLAAAMDYFNIMSYDYYGGWSEIAGHNSPLFPWPGQEANTTYSWNTTLTGLAELGVPLAKVNMGVAFYGRGVVTSGQGAVNAPTIKTSRTVQPDGPIVSAADFTNWSAAEGVPYHMHIMSHLSGWTEQWDDHAKVPYLSRSGAFLSYDDERSVGLKAKYIRDNQLAGAIIWTAFGDLEIGPIDGGSAKLPYSSTTRSPLVNTLNAVLAGDPVPGETSGFLSIASTNVREGDSGSVTMRFAVSLSAASTHPVSVDYATSNGSASAGEDYTSASGTLIFAPGETRKEIDVVVLGDVIEEGHETLNVSLSQASGASVAAASASGTILNDDGESGTPSLPRISIAGASKAEGNSGSSDLIFTVTLDAASAEAVSVSYATSNGTAVAGSDYSASSGILTFLAGETLQTIRVPITGDTGVEPDETFSVTLSNPSGATLAISSAIGTIVNDDSESGGSGTLFGLGQLPADRPIVMGYLNSLRSPSGTEQSLNASQIQAEINGLHWAGYDVLVHAFAEPLANGTLGEDLGNFKAYQSALLSHAHGQGKGVILSIGGAYPARLAGQFSTIAQSSSLRATFVNHVVQYLKTHGYDGVDIDWEFPDSAQERAALNLLMADLHAAVKEEDPDYIVMFGTGPGYYMGGYDFATLKNHCDFFFYFGYDWKGASPSGANGPIRQPGSGVQWTTGNDTMPEKSVRGGLQYVLNKGFPASKIICGLPFYGSSNTSWSAVRGIYAADSASYDAAIDDDALEVLINHEWFTSPTALKRKMDALLLPSSSVLDQGAAIRGVGTWEIGHEHRSNPDLSIAFEEWISDYSGTPVLPRLSIADASVIEGNSGSTTLSFQVSLDREADGVVTVDYATSNGSASAGSDYTATSGTLTFNAGETAKTLSVTVHGDTLDEGHETLTVTLSNPSANALVQRAVATGTILDDDGSTPEPSLSIAGASVAEGNSGSSTANVTVTLQPAATGPVTVNYATANGTAQAGSDYTAVSGSLTFSAGQTSRTIAIPILGDTAAEPDESFTVILSQPTGAVLGTSSATVVILNDDSGSGGGGNDSGWVRHYQESSSEVAVETVTPAGGSVWGTGFSGIIKITNLTAQPISTWTLAFDAPWTTTGSGNAGSWTISQGRHTVTQPSWQGYLFGPGETISIDFTGSGSWVEPTQLTFNGKPLAAPDPNHVSLDAWKSLHGVEDVEADSDGDEVPDLVEFLLGRNPSQADDGMALTPRLEKLTIEGVEDTYLCLELEVNAYATGVEYRLESSEDLQTWQAGSSAMLMREATEDEAGHVSASWRAAVPVGQEGSPRFVRLAARVAGENEGDHSSSAGGDSSGGGEGVSPSGGGSPGTGTQGPAGAPAVPTVSILKDWSDGVGHRVQWNTWGGEKVTEWKVYQNGTLVHAAGASGAAPQSDTFDFDEATIGSFTYIVEVSNNAGTSSSAPATYLSDFASAITLPEKDLSGQVSQITMDAGTGTLAIHGGVAPYKVTVNHPAALAAAVEGKVVTLQGVAGMRSGLKIEDAAGNVRLVGVRVRRGDGSLPGVPPYLAIGSVSEDSAADLDFWSDYQPGTLRNKWVDFRYIYINGGVKRKGVGWRTWSSVDGDRMRTFVRESIKRGMIPVVVWYNIPDGGESYTTDKEHMQDEDYMRSYFEDLKFAIDIANEEAGDEMVAWVLEPDFIGYMAQNHENPALLMARTHAAYDEGVLDVEDGDPLFPDTLRGLVEAINFTLKKHSRHSWIGWQFNLWAFPAGGWHADSKVGVKGLMRLTDEVGMEAGRGIIRSEGLAVADYYASCGILTHGADFVSIDKYGLDGGAEQKNEDPSWSTWFWNAEHWSNYLHYVDALRDRTGKPVVLWQLPVGHINHSQEVSPYSGEIFPNHPNAPLDWEDSAPSFFFGDTFVPGAGHRYSWFSRNDGGYAEVHSDADEQTLTWGEHLTAAREAGVQVALFGDGVGNSTRGRGDSNTDEFWWMVKVQKYYQNPVPLEP